MPQPQLTPEEWATLVEKLESIRHFLLAVPRAPELEEAVQRELADVRACLAILGVEP